MGFLCNKYVMNFAKYFMIVLKFDSGLNALN